MGSVTDRRGYEDALQGFNFYMDGWEENNPLYYSVWNGQKLKFVSKEEDKEAAKQEFMNILEVYKRNGTGGQLEVRFHEKRPNNTLNSKSDYAGSFTFVIFEYSSNAPFNPAAAPAVNHVQSSISSIQQLVNDITALEQLKAVLFPGMGSIGNDTPPEPRSKVDSILDRIESFITTPIGEELIAGAAEKWLGLPMSQFKNNAAMAGDNDAMIESVVMSDDDTENDRLQAVLVRLFKGERDFISILEKLADLKEKQPMKYSMAKQML